MNQVYPVPIKTYMYDKHSFAVHLRHKGPLIAKQLKDPYVVSEQQKPRSACRSAVRLELSLFYSKYTVVQ